MLGTYAAGGLPDFFDMSLEKVNANMQAIPIAYIPLLSGLLGSNINFKVMPRTNTMSMTNAAVQSAAFFPMARLKTTNRNSAASAKPDPNASEVTIANIIAEFLLVPNARVKRRTAFRASAWTTC